MVLSGRWTASATGLMCFNYRKYKIQGRGAHFPFQETGSKSGADAVITDCRVHVDF